jgi:alpha-ketoglutarate-dependent taurine dioxygenase
VTTPDPRTTRPGAAMTVSDLALPTFPAVRTRLWDEAHPFIVFTTATDPERCSSPDWFAEHRASIRDTLDRFGAMYFRGFTADSHGFEQIVDAIADDPLPYLGGVSPRASVHGTILTATEAPPQLPIVQHHEMSYHNYTPRYICFYCERPADEGGATPICDGRRFTRAMEAAAPEVVDELERKGALFVRNYNDANFKGWRETWHTSDRAALEAFLRESGAEWAWIDDGWLQTRQRVPAVIRDPHTGGRVLYASINLWHRSYVRSMNEACGVALPDDPERQPYRTFFGDGTPIPDAFIDKMHEVHREQRVVIPYQAGDFMLVHNFVTSHGKDPYVPPRKVYVTLREKVYMTEPPFRTG